MHPPEPLSGVWQFIACIVAVSCQAYGVPKVEPLGPTSTGAMHSRDEVDLEAAHADSRQIALITEFIASSLSSD